MTKKTKALILTIITIFLTFANCVPIAAYENTDSGIAPAFNNCVTCVFGFHINSQGVANIDVEYNGFPDRFTRCQITAKIQKRVLGIFWKRVDIGLPDNYWVSISSDVNGYFFRGFQLSETGTYRAVIVLEVYGVDDTIDKIEETIEAVYS